MDADPGPSTTSGRQLRQRKRLKYDNDAESDDDADHLDPSPAKRVARRRPRSPSVRRTRKMGKLATFVNLPLDILHEIFGHLHPYELLKLARTTKDFRRLIMHKSSISTWRQSFAMVEGLPECPPGMTEPAWANLVFSPQCHVCLTAGVRNVEWRFRIRMCAKCAPDQLIETYPAPSMSMEDLYRSIPGGFGVEIQNLPDIRYLLPNREGKKFKRVFMRRDLITFRDKYKGLETPEERLAFIDERRKATEEINLHATNCAAWSHNQADDRSDELIKLRQERKQAIVKKLEELGYKKDLDRMRYPDSLDRQAFVNKPQRLTERIWNNIKPSAIKYMDEMRQKRLTREFETLVLSRRTDAGRFLRLVKNRMLPQTEVLPGLPDFCQLPQVAGVLRQPLDVAVDSTSFEAPTHPIEALFSSWRENAVIPFIHRLILTSEIDEYFQVTHTCPKGSKQLVGQLPGFNIPVERVDVGVCLEGTALVSTREQIHTKMKLAATVYKCGACGSLLFYPQVLGHPCNFRSQESGVNYTALKVPWHASRLLVDRKASEIAALVVARSGLDPAAATAEDMDHLDLRFYCNECITVMAPAAAWLREAKQEDDDDPDLAITTLRSCYTWRGAVKHQVKHHKEYEHVRPGGQWYKSSPYIGNLSTIQSPDPMMAQIRKEEAHRERKSAEIWCCAHCRDSPQEKELLLLPDIKSHLAASHELLSPVLDTDYFKHYAARDRPTSLVLIPDQDMMTI